MKFYLASRFHNAPELLKIRDHLLSVGHEVVSTWHATYDGEDDLLDENGDITDFHRAREVSLKDLEEIDASDAILIYTKGCEKTPGGMNFEAGYAYAKGKHLLIYGEPVNIFLTLGRRLIGYCGRIRLE